MIHAKINPKSQKYDMKLVDITMDMCRLTKGAPNLFLNQMITAFKKHSNYSLKCPTKKGFYCLNNLRTDQVMSPVKQFQFHIKSTISVVVENKTEKRRLLFAELFGKYSSE